MHKIVVVALTTTQVLGWYEVHEDQTKTRELQDSLNSEEYPYNMANGDDLGMDQNQSTTLDDAEPGMEESMERRFLATQNFDFTKFFDAIFECYYCPEDTSW